MNSLGVIGAIARRPVAAPVGPVPHSWWRVKILTVQNSTNFAGIGELQFRTSAGAVSIPSGGTAFSSSDNGASFDAAKAFDNDTATYWSSASGSNIDSHVGYNFPTARTVVEVYLVASSSPEYTPTSFTVQYSDDGVTWTDAWTSWANAWTALEGRTFAKVDPATLPTALVNPGGETGDTTGWRRTGFSLPSSVATATGATGPRTGTRFFHGGSAATGSTLTQRIGVPVANLPDVAAGRLRLDFKAYFCGFDDGASATIKFYDTNEILLSSITKATLALQTGWSEYNIPDLTVPLDTRFVGLTISFINLTSTVTYVSVDDVELAWRVAAAQKEVNRFRSSVIVRTT